MSSDHSHGQDHSDLDGQDHHEAGPSDLVVSHDVQATREQLWAAITEPDLVAQWFGPEGTRVPRESVEIVPEVGGPYRLTMVVDAMPGFESPVSATVVEVVPGRLLVGEESVTPSAADIEHALQHGEDVPEPLTLRLRLGCEDREGGARLTLSQGAFPAGVADQARLGWESSFRKLDTLLRP